MDLSQYLDDDQGRLAPLARRSLVPILRLRKLAAQTTQPMRYLTARRIVAASDGVITMEALARRGKMRGADTYDGPLGRVIADIVSTGPELTSRLAAAGLAVDQLTETLLRGRVPRASRMKLYIAAFAPVLRPHHFREHAAWRAGTTGS